MKFYCNVDEQGKAIFENREVMVQYIASLKNSMLCFDIEKIRNTRTIKQNRYYWGVIVPMINNGLIELGNDVDIEITHEFLKCRFLSKKKVLSIEDELIEFDAPSTRKLTIQEFSIYIESCINFASEYLNLNVPYPNEH